MNRLLSVPLSDIDGWVGVLFAQLIDVHMRCQLVYQSLSVFQAKNKLIIRLHFILFLCFAMKKRRNKTIRFDAAS